LVNKGNFNSRKMSFYYKPLKQEIDESKLINHTPVSFKTMSAIDLVTSIDHQQHHSPTTKLFSTTNQISETSLSSLIGEPSTDGFGQQHEEELECKNLYHNFEGSMQSLDSEQQQESKNENSSFWPSSFRNVFNNVIKY